MFDYDIFSAKMLDKNLVSYLYNFVISLFLGMYFFYKRHSFLKLIKGSGSDEELLQKIIAPLVTGIVMLFSVIYMYLLNLASEPDNGYPYVRYGVIIVFIGMPAIFWIFCYFPVIIWMYIKTTNK